MTMQEEFNRASAQKKAVIIAAPLLGAAIIASTFYHNATREWPKVEKTYAPSTSYRTTMEYGEAVTGSKLERALDNKWKVAQERAAFYQQKWADGYRAREIQLQYQSNYLQTRRR